MRTRKSLALRDVQALGSDWLGGRDSAPKSGERHVSRSAPEDGLTSHQRGGAEWSGWEVGIRTPIIASRARCPTVERPPSAEGSSIIAAGFALRSRAAMSGQSRLRVASSSHGDGSTGDRLASRGHRHELRAPAVAAGVDPSSSWCGCERTEIQSRQRLREVITDLTPCAFSDAA